MRYKYFDTIEEITLFREWVLKHYGKFENITEKEVAIFKETDEYRELIENP